MRLVRILQPVKPVLLLIRQVFRKNYTIYERAAAMKTVGLPVIKNDFRPVLCGTIKISTTDLTHRKYMVYL